MSHITSRSRKVSDFCLRLPAFGTSIKLVSKESPSATAKMQSDISKGREKMCGRSRHSLQNFRDERRKIQTLSEARERANSGKDPGRTKFSDVARLFVVRPFVPSRWKCWPATKLRNSRECRGRASRRKFEGAKPGEGKGPKEIWATGRCRGGVWTPWRIWRVCARGCWMDRRQSEAPDVYACYSRVSGMARITINMLDSRLTAVVPVPTRRYPRRTHSVGLPPSIWQTL